MLCSQSDRSPLNFQLIKSTQELIQSLIKSEFLQDIVTGSFQKLKNELLKIFDSHLNGISYI